MMSMLFDADFAEFTSYRMCNSKMNRIYIPRKQCIMDEDAQRKSGQALPCYVVVKYRKMCTKCNTRKQGEMVSFAYSPLIDALLCHSNPSLCFSVLTAILLLLPLFFFYFWTKSGYDGLLWGYKQYIRNDSINHLLSITDNFLSLSISLPLTSLCIRPGTFVLLKKRHVLDDLCITQNSSHMNPIF